MNSANVRLDRRAGPMSNQPREKDMSLTKRQREILTYLETYTEEHGYAPSFEEIATQFNYNSLATVHEHLTNLERKGYIKRAYNESRGIELVPSEVFPRAAALPLLGTVAAGMPIEAIPNPGANGVPQRKPKSTHPKSRPPV